MAIAIGLIVAAVASGFVCGRLLSGNPMVQLKRRPVTLVIVGVMVVLGAVMIWREVAAIEMASARRNWAKVQGRVTLSEVRGQRAYHPFVAYEYEVEGATYQGESTLQAPGFGPKSSRREVARKSLADYGEGEALLVYHDPATPGESCLKTGAPWDTFMRLSLGAVLVFVGAGVGGTLRHGTGRLANGQDDDGPVVQGDA